MKRNIVDFLDTYMDENVDLACGTPLSPARIKELTMNKINNKKEKNHRLRAPARVFVAVAAAAVLSISALAANGVFGAGSQFQDYFAKGSAAPLTEGQITTMDEIGKTFEEGVTSNGATITPIAAIADENIYYLRLRIEAPEGTTLPDLDGDTDGYYQLSGNSYGEFYTRDWIDAYEISGGSIELNWLPDSDPTDNVKEVVLLYTTQAGADLQFNDGVSKPLTIHGLWIQTPDKEYIEVFHGEFTFDLGMYYEGQAVSLDCAGVTWTDPTYGYTNMLESLKLSPLSLSFQSKSNLMENDVLGTTGGGEFLIVLKDGTVFCDNTCPKEEMDPRFDPAFISDTYVAEYEDYVCFDTPLDITQVDYVQFGDFKIPVNVE